jgi:short-subunit dehydrogenase
MSRRQLKGMVVAISGASAGIGRELAMRLGDCEPNAKVALCARRTDRFAIFEEMNHDLCHPNGMPFLCLRADVSRTEDCEMFIARAIEHFGRLDTLVCNAGYGMYKKTADFTPAEMREMFATNVFGTTDLIRVAVGAMAKQQPRPGEKWRGQIMIVSSAAARRGVPFLGPYSATKAAQLSIAEALRVELRPLRIAVTSVHPIMTKTEFGSAAESKPGSAKLPRGERFTQTVEHVVKRMIKAIERPIPEVWPHRPSRWALGMAALFPRMADRMMGKYASDIERENPKSETRNPNQ